MKKLDKAISGTRANMTKLNFQLYKKATAKPDKIWKMYCNNRPTLSPVPSFILSKSLEIIL